MSNNGNTKKRRVEGGGARVSIDGGGIIGGGENSSAELSAIKSMMLELVNQNRIQTNMMQSMQGKINNMHGEITRLSNKCNTMETKIKSVKLSQRKSLAAIKTLQSAHHTKSDDMKSQLNGVDEKLKYHDILLQNQKWKYSAPRPSDDYWNSLDGEDQQAEEFLKQIQKFTEKMRYGQGDGFIDLYAEAQYHKEMLPHWKEFASALEQYHHHLNLPTEKKTLHLIDMELPDEVVDLLSNALKSTHFEMLILGRNNNFGQKGVDFVLNYVKNNPIMKEFGMVENPMNHMNIKRLCEVIQTHSSIKLVGFPRCKGEDIDGYEMLKMIMNAGKNKLTAIDLGGNSISTGGDDTFISDFLTKNPILETLILSGNQLNDNDAFDISDVLKRNKELAILDLTQNNITKTGWKALRKAEFDNTSLNTAADSNHTCNIRYPPVNSDVIEGLDISEMNGNLHPVRFEPKYVRQKKIYTVLSTRNRNCSNVGNFDDLPVELLPDMLDSIHKYSNYSTSVLKTSQGSGDVNPLSIVYEVCRHWEESLAVFEALSS